MTGTESMDVYQDRYLEHRSRKAAMLAGENSIARPGSGCFDFCDKLPLLKYLLEERRSQRVFNGEHVSDDQWRDIAEAIWLSPSSCNRQAIKVRAYNDEWPKRRLSELLVGGKGWIGNVDIIALLFADAIAYKAPGEVAYMPYLDAGVCVQSAYLAAEAIGIGCCFVNPNIRDENKADFERIFNKGHHAVIFCGALAFGHYDMKALKPSRRDFMEMFG